MFVLVKKENPNEWLCYDSLCNDYYFRPAWNFQVSMYHNMRLSDLNVLPQEIRDQVKPMKLDIVDIEILNNGDFI